MNYELNSRSFALHFLTSYTTNATFDPQTTFNYPFAKGQQLYHGSFIRRGFFLCFRAFLILALMVTVMDNCCKDLRLVSNGLPNDGNKLYRVYDYYVSTSVTSRGVSASVCHMPPLHLQTNVRKRENVCQQIHYRRRRTKRPTDRPLANIILSSFNYGKC